ncbi:BtrH N-terminal domain-containing protein [Pseudonocardia kongjuensis]|uniref:BtrH N-terminal domain-containing protein n=1 Tax=Pseudonocardia kongjuensis TaxID=102227 RepID=A0ABN1XS07_9PSEU
MTGHLVPDYPHHLAGHCGSGSLRDLIEWAGLDYAGTPLSESMVFGLGGDLGFRYVRGTGLGTPFYLVGRGPELTTRLCSRLGIGHEVRSTDDPELGWSWVRAEVDAGRPVLCWADMGELPYLNVRMHMSRHDIVVIGYDGAAGTVQVVDNDRADVQTIGLDDLARARRSTAFPVPTRHTCYPMRFPDALPPIAVAAASACADSAEGMAADVGPSLGDPDSVQGAGLTGIGVFVDDLDSWARLWDDQHLDVALRALAVFIEKAGTGGGLFRRFQADFLAELHDLCPIPAVAGARDAWTPVAETWRRIAHRATSSSGTAAERHDVIRQLSAPLPEMETAAVKALADAATDLAA